MKPVFNIARVTKNLSSDVKPDSWTDVSENDACECQVCGAKNNPEFVPIKQLFTLLAVRSLAVASRQRTALTLNRKERNDGTYKRKMGGTGRPYKPM